ncbi:MAG: NADH-quinone oxidoreductase subunit N [Cognaticolwellia sp.]
MMSSVSNLESMFTMTMASAILPQLIVAFGIVLALLLVAWRRSQRIISLFTCATLLVSLFANFALISIPVTQVTQLLKVDGYSIFAFSLVLISTLTALRLSHSFLKAHIEVHDEYYILLLLLVLGAGILVISDHFASLFLGFELLSISLVGLVGYHRESDYSVESGFKYLILSATASSFMLLGIAFIYSITGDMSFNAMTVDAAMPNAAMSNADIANADNPLATDLFLHLGILLFISGIAFKLSLAPFHFWVPDVYQGAPTPITMLMATISKIAMFVVLLKCIVAQRYLLQDSFQLLLMILAVISMLLGNIMALKQQSLKRLLAYSSIAHMGYLLIVIIVTSEQSIAFSWQTSLFYLAAYMVANLSIFIVISLMQLPQGNSRYQEDISIVDLRGLFWRAPSCGVLLILAVLSLAGIPLTMGFIAKFYILSQATLANAWWLITTLIIGSGIGLAYYLPMIFKLFESELTASTQGQLAKDHMLEKLLIFSFIVVGLLFGILPDVINQFILV